MRRNRTPSVSKRTLVKTKRTSVKKSVRQHAADLIQEYETTGKLSADAYEKLDKLEKLSRLNELARQSRVHLFYSVGCILFLLVSLLVPVLVRVQRTEIELIVSTTKTSFTTFNEQRQTIVEDLSFNEIGFADVSSVTISNMRPIENPGNAPFPLKIKSLVDQPPNITLEELTPPPGTSVDLSINENPDPFSMVLETSDRPFLLELEIGDVDNVDIFSSKSIALDEGSLTIGSVQESDNRNILQFTFGILSEREELARQVVISSLKFTEVNVESDAQGTIVKRVSGIKSGTLYLESLNGREIILRPGELLRFKRAEGILRVIELRQGRLDVQFRGTVQGMQIGSEETPRDLMPTLLEWLQAKTSIMTLLSGLLALLLAMSAVFIDWQRSSRA